MSVACAIAVITNSIDKYNAFLRKPVIVISLFSLMNDPRLLKTCSFLVFQLEVKAKSKLQKKFEFLLS